MTKETLTKKTIPDVPGVYFFFGPRKNILYIGKATSLRNRIRSYFDTRIHEKRSVLIEKMVVAATQVEWTKTDSVIEAMILEANLIRTHKPEYNTISKDDKSFNQLVITKEEFPRVLVVRSKDVTERFKESDLLCSFGPFTHGAQFKEALKIIRHLFKYYDTTHPLNTIKSKVAQGRIDFNRQIGLYPEVQSKAEYARTIRHIRLFFEGKKSRVIQELEREMMRAAQHEAFEMAHELKRRIFALRHIQDIALLKNEQRMYRDERMMRIEAYDIAHLAGSDMVGVMTVVEGGSPDTSSYRRFKINSCTDANDPKALREVIERRLAHPEWPYPQLIVVDGGIAQKHAIERVLKSSGVVIPVVSVVKDERHNPKRILGLSTVIQKHEQVILLANAESHRFAIAYHRTKRRLRYKSE